MDMPQRLLNIALDIIYPPKCMACSKIIGKDAAYGLCDDCRNGLHFLAGETCVVCGRQGFLSGGKCFSCMEHEYAFIRNFAAISYGGVSRQILLRFKYNNNQQFAARLAGLVFENTPALLDIMPEVDLFAPVPLHKKRMRERGFNQAELLAKELAKLYEKPYHPRMLSRTRATEKQSLLTASERRANISGAFAVAEPKSCKGKTILLVDDIFTSGATLDGCAKALLEAGCGRVFCVTVAVAGLSGKDAPLEDRDEEML